MITCSGRELGVLMVAAMVICGSCKHEGSIAGDLEGGGPINKKFTESGVESIISVAELPIITSEHLDCVGHSSIRCGFIDTSTYIYFDFDRSEIRADMISALAKAAGRMQREPNKEYLIYGFTDTRGPTQYNLDLSYQRAATVRDYLIKEGIAHERFSIISKGESHPLGQKEDEESHSRNRRVEIVENFH